MSGGTSKPFLFLTFFFYVFFLKDRFWIFPMRPLESQESKKRTTLRLRDVSLTLLREVPPNAPPNKLALQLLNIYIYKILPRTGRNQWTKPNLHWHPRMEMPTPTHNTSLLRLKFNLCRHHLQHSETPQARHPRESERKNGSPPTRNAPLLRSLETCVKIHIVSFIELRRSF